MTAPTLVAALAALLGACGALDGATRTDAAARDATFHDARDPDAAARDATFHDARDPDASPSDGSRADAAAPAGCLDAEAFDDPGAYDAACADGGTCAPTCSAAITSVRSEANPYGKPVTVTYAMVGGGGGGASPCGGTTTGGGGGGGSAILLDCNLVGIARGGAGGPFDSSTDGGVDVSGASGAKVTGSFVLSGSAKLSVYVGGGGGGSSGTGQLGGTCSGGGGGAGYLGGGGGGLSGLCSVDASTCSTTAGGGGAEGGRGGAGATSGGIATGGNGADDPYDWAGGGGGADGDFGGDGSNAGSGGGGGFGGGGGTGGEQGGNGGSVGANGGCSTGFGDVCGSTAPPLGASAWMNATVLPAAAGTGGAGSSRPGIGSAWGGNAGLVILSYTPPDGVCRL